MSDELLKTSRIYFAVGICEVLAECLEYIPAILVLKPLVPLVLMLVYRKTSRRQHPLFYLTMFFSFLTNIFFLPVFPDFLFVALIAFTLHRIVLLTYVIKIVKIKDYFPLIIGFIPFFCLFSYVFKFAGDVPEIMYGIIVLQNIMISLLGGIALSNYIVNDNGKNSWLYMSGLLFVLLQFVIFIERYYITIAIFRPLAMALNVCAFYCFYRFILSTEKSYDDSTA